MIIREALPAELAEVGDLRVAAYLADDFLSPSSGYIPRLRALGAEPGCTVLVAVAGEGPIVGTVMLQSWPGTGQVVTGPDEAEIRALAVAPDARGGGLGQALLSAVLERAAGQGARQLVLSTQREMRAAHRLYERNGFRRLPDRDWSPESGTKLLVYGLELNGHTATAS